MRTHEEGGELNEIPNLEVRAQQNSIFKNKNSCRMGARGSHDARGNQCTTCGEKEQARTNEKAGVEVSLGCTQDEQ